MTEWYKVTIGYARELQDKVLYEAATLEKPCFEESPDFDLILPLFLLFLMVMQWPWFDEDAGLERAKMVFLNQEVEYKELLYYSSISGRKGR